MLSSRLHLVETEEELLYIVEEFSQEVFKELYPEEVYNPYIEAILGMFEMGVFKVFTLKDEGTIVGVFSFTIVPDIFTSELVAAGVSIQIKKEYRGRFNIKAIFKELEELFKSLGATKFDLCVRNNNMLKLEALGFTLIEHRFSKGI